MPRPQPAPEPPAAVAWADGAMSGPAWAQLVEAVITLIKQGRADKVVLARDLIATSPEPIDLAWLVQQLSASYPSCWTFLVDGLVGATPEMLARLSGGLVTSRVLAGTIRRTERPEDDAARLAGALLASGKDLREHELAVESVVAALRGLTASIHVPEAPYVLDLPNVLHLATEITALAPQETSSLAIAASLHPSAAVCGTPTHIARDLIAEFEGVDRGRYAGPVGWIDSMGDGEWAIALRCGRVQPSTPNEIQLFAGCGVVADSDPEDELVESVAKFRPMRDALGS